MAQAVLYQGAWQGNSYQGAWQVQATAYSDTLTDSMTGADALIEAAGKALSDSMTGADVLTQVADKAIAIADTMTGVDLMPRVLLDCDGQYYAVADNLAVHDISTEDISVSAWIRVGPTESGSVVSKSSIWGGGYNFYINASGFIAGVLDEQWGSSFNIVGTTDIRDNVWHHIALVVDKNNNNNCKVLLDGVDDTDTRDDITLVGSIINGETFQIGRVFTGSQIFDGQLCDAKLYYATDDIWSSAEILYQAEHPFDHSSAAGSITEYWDCLEGSGVIVNGSVDNDLTLSNAAAWVSTNGPDRSLLIAVSKLLVDYMLSEETLTEDAGVPIQDVMTGADVLTETGAGVITLSDQTAPTDQITVKDATVVRADTMSGADALSGVLGPGILPGLADKVATPVASRRKQPNQGTKLVTNRPSPLTSVTTSSTSTTFTDTSVQDSNAWDVSDVDIGDVVVTADEHMGFVTGTGANTVNVEGWILRGVDRRGKAISKPDDAQSVTVHKRLEAGSILLCALTTNTVTMYFGFDSEVTPVTGHPVSFRSGDVSNSIVLHAPAGKVLNLSDIWVIAGKDQYLRWQTDSEHRPNLEPHGSSEDVGSIPVADSMSGAELMISDAEKGLADSMTPTEVLTEAAGRGIADTMSGADVLWGAINLITDSMATGVDEITLDAHVTIADSMTGADELSGWLDRLTDSMTGADSVISDAEKELADSMAGADTLVAPWMELDPVDGSTLAFGSGGTTDTVTVTHIGTGDVLNWTLEIVGGNPWLTADVSSGSLGVGESEVVTLTVNREGLEAGVYNATLNFTTPNDGNGSIGVTMEVVAGVPVLGLNPASGSTIDYGPDGTTDTVTVTNIGTGILIWSVATNSWLTPDIPSGSLAEGVSEVVTFTVDRTGIDPNCYEQSASFSSNGGSGSVLMKMRVRGHVLIRFPYLSPNDVEPGPCYTCGLSEHGGAYELDADEIGDGGTFDMEEYLSWTELTTPEAGSRFLDHAAGGFTAGLVGQEILILGGLNFVADTYLVTSYDRPDRIRLDRTPTPGDPGSGGTAKIALRMGWVFYIRGCSGEIGDEITIFVSAGTSEPWLYYCPTFVGDDCWGKTVFGTDIPGEIGEDEGWRFYSQQQAAVRHAPLGGDGDVPDDSVYMWWARPIGYTVIYCSQNQNQATWNTFIANWQSQRYSVVARKITADTWELVSGSNYQE